ncbi:YqaE/Pmp3 family membrane protein [Compostibacter hankyongensis]|uniref:YqaE/Pmp3 family membrane protein n=1 Tax=Compostibacter hankyongensis TaxID=1007089 RepID=A0ABP8FY64_9BACT
MRYFLAILLPPLAVLTTGKVGSFLLNILLTILGWIPGCIHACLIVHEHYENKRTRKLIRAMSR